MQLQTLIRSFVASKTWRSVTLGLAGLGCLVGGQVGPLAAQSNTPAQPPAQVQAGETIVYVQEDGRELRLIQPDGSDDRLLWRVPDSVIGSAISNVVWRPDAQQIAFTSNHEATCSEFGADIYLINPDGSNLRRLTNAPACAELAAYAQGSASVRIENRLSNLSEFLVYMEGAPDAKVVTVPANSSLLVAFPQVADLGSGVMQAAVAINGTTRWFDAAIMADVQAGQNSHLGTLVISGSGFAAYGATQPSWSSDGSKLAYQLGQGKLWQVGLNVPILGEGGPLLAAPANNSVAGTHPRWSPVGNEVLYQRFDTARFSISRATVDGSSAGTALAAVRYITGLDWLNDGSGFVVADDDSLLTHTDLYLMTFADGQISQLTQTSGRQVAAEPSFSPDDMEIVYTYAEDAQAKPLNPQLRIMNRDGSGDRLLIAGGRVADWSRVAPQNPPNTPQPTATTQPTPGVTPSPEDTPSPGVTPSPEETPAPGGTPTPDVKPPAVKLHLPQVRR